MVDEPDGVNEMVIGGLRVALTAALHIAEQRARVRAQLAREAATADAQRARELQARLDAERAAARAAVAPLGEDVWWTSPRIEDLPHTWATAREWAEHDPDIARVADRIRREVSDRWGIDVDAPDVDLTDLRAEIERRAQRDLEQRAAQAAAKREDTEAAVAMAVVDRKTSAPQTAPESSAATAAEQAAEGLRVAAGKDDTTASLHATTADQAARDGDEAAAVHEQKRADVIHDSAERRRDTAAQLEQQADAEVAEAWSLADSHQAQPPTAAARVSAARSARRRPRNQRSRAGERDVTR